MGCPEKRTIRRGAKAWSYELKFDGYRTLGIKANGKIRLLSRNGKDFTARFSSIAKALETLSDDTVIDGEIVAYGTDGRPSFNVLQNYRSNGPELHLYAFDLLALSGKDLKRESLERRREFLRTTNISGRPTSVCGRRECRPAKRKKRSDLRWAFFTRRCPEIVCRTFPSGLAESAGAEDGMPLRTKRRV
jgi:ATP-dependent DNA ligase